MSATVTMKLKDGSVHRFEDGRWEGPPIPPDERVIPPTIPQKMRHLGMALLAWQKAGRPMASKALRQHRQEICNACSFWHPQGNFWLGECSAPGCGCTKAKAFLATSVCTHPEGSRWPA